MWGQTQPLSWSEKNAVWNISEYTIECKNQYIWTQWNVKTTVSCNMHIMNTVLKSKVPTVYCYVDRLMIFCNFELCWLTVTNSLLLVSNFWSNCFSWPPVLFHNVCPLLTRVYIRSKFVSSLKNFRMPFCGSIAHFPDMFRTIESTAPSSDQFHILTLSEHLILSFCGGSALYQLFVCFCHVGRTFILWLGTSRTLLSHDFDCWLQVRVKYT